MVKEREILPLVDLTLDKENPREWFYALMDYGAMLKKRLQTPIGRVPTTRDRRPLRAPTGKPGVQYSGISSITGPWRNMSSSPSWG
jgi:hypothetical protein